MSRYEGPTPLGSTLRHFLSRYRAVSFGAFEEIASKWKDVVGEPLASLAEPELLKNHVLFVRVGTGVVAQAVKEREKVILTAFADLGDDAPLEIRLQVGAPPRRS
jgi:predicted nucleic acid-binding Zn ribbon protein